MCVNSMFWSVLFLQSKLCHMEPTQDDGRSTTVLRHFGAREGKRKKEKWGFQNKLVWIAMEWGKIQW